MKKYILILILSTGSGLTSAAELTLQSGQTRTVMIELFTSEGCSSCPPAERFLAGLVENRHLWKTYIPLAFHVDYWDYLGWQDRFASAANTRRQREYGRALNAPTIYTPEFIVNGREWRRPVFGGLPSAPDEQVGNLRAVLHGTKLSVDFDSQHYKKQPLDLHIALLGMGLQTRVAAGENAGRRLAHEFVVLSRKRLPGVTRHWETGLPENPGKHAVRMALVLWLSTGSDPRPLQATGAYLPE